MHVGTSLAGQRLRLCASNAGGVGLIPAWRTKFPHVRWHGRKMKNKFFVCFHICFLLKWIIFACSLPIFSFFKKIFLTEGWLLYNIMLASTIHQHESAIGIPMSPPSWTSTPSHPSRLLQSLGLSSLSHTANSHWLSILHMVVHISMLPSPKNPTYYVNSLEI